MDEMMRKIDHYFDTVSDEQLWADARAAGFRIVPKSPWHNRLADWLLWLPLDIIMFFDPWVTWKPMATAEMTCKQAIWALRMRDGGWSPARYV